VTIDTAISGMPTCVRKAWLVLPNTGTQIQLDNPSGGWMCQSLDLGTPVMRTVMNPAPDRSGIIDRTSLMGARTVVAAVTALTGAGGQIDAVAASFAPYMDPAQRPVLHYVLDRPGAPERTLTLRPDSYDWPIVGAVQRDIALQWIAPDPVVYDPTVKSVTVAAGAGNVQLNSPGDLGLRPVVAVTGPAGPATQFYVAMNTWSATPGPLHSLGTNTIAFLSTYTLPAGQTVTIDCAARTAKIGTTSVLNQIDWSRSNWPVLPVSPAYTNCALTVNTGSTGATSVTVSWNDAYYS
jgi:hypothetical protein